MNAELYRRGVPALVRVAEVVRAPAYPGAPDWTFALDRSPVPLCADDTAARYAEALFRYEGEVAEVAAWAADRFAVEWDEVPARAAVFIPSSVHAAHPQPADGQVPAERAARGD